MNEYSADHLSLISSLSDGMSPEVFEEFNACLRDNKPKEGITDAYIYACHDAVTGIEFIEDGSAPTGPVDFVDG